MPDNQWASEETRWLVDIRAAALLTVLAFVAGLSACRVSFPFASEIFFTEGADDFPSAADCERCHQEIFLEWQDSPHANAFRSERFQRATHAGTAAPCVGCHAPGPLVSDVSPSLRAVHREEGVTCATCHLATGPGVAPLTMRGPVARSSPVEIHPVTIADADYRSSVLCGGCHRAAYEEWSMATTGDTDAETCQTCHMPSVHRKVESVNDEVPYSGVFVALEREERLRRHRFAVPEDASEHLYLEAVRNGIELDIVVENDLPHALPTGRFGRRQIEIALDWPGGSIAEPLARQPLDPIAPGRSRTRHLTLPGSAAGQPVTLSLRRFDHGDEGFADLLRVEVPADPDGPIRSGRQGQ